MCNCSLKYIPEHLHWNSREIISDFFDEERLYWRLGERKAEVPYSDIKLADVSVNRSGSSDNLLSRPEDALWNVESKNDFEKYSCPVVTLSVKKAFPHSQTKKFLKYPESDVLESGTTPISCIMSLEHDPLSCNYSHSMFVFDVEDIRVTFNNYDQTFGKKTYKRLRQICRDELHKALIKEEIHFK